MIKMIKIKQKSIEGRRTSWVSQFNRLLANLKYVLLLLLAYYQDILGIQVQKSKKMIQTFQHPEGFHQFLNFVLLGYPIICAEHTYIYLCILYCYLASKYACCHINVNHTVQFSNFESALLRRRLQKWTFFLTCVIQSKKPKIARVPLLTFLLLIIIFQVCVFLGQQQCTMSDFHDFGLT